MRTIISLLAIAAFSLHILLGCSWHHAHVANEFPGHVHGPQAYDHVHVRALVPQKAHSCCDQEHDDADEEDEEHHEICTDPQCVFLHPGLVTFDLIPQAALLPVLSSDMLVQSASRHVLGQWDDRGKFPPDVPLFLALEHFLN